jgi:D-amino peptidase
MKKIFISADFEGASGVVDPRQCSQGHPWFDSGRRMWTSQINAVVEGALSAGAEEVLVNEAHAQMNYLDMERLHPCASLVSGYVKVDNQMHGLDSSFAGAILLGHAQAGTRNGVLAHTYVMREVVEIRLNGSPIGEFGLSSLWAAYHHVPVILAVGDDRYCEEARRAIPGIETAVVKVGVSAYAAQHLPLEQANRLAHAAAARAVAGCDQLLAPALPGHFRMEIEFVLPQAADLCAFIPTVERVDGRTIVFEAEDYRALQQVRIVCTNLALSVASTYFPAH